MSATPPMPAPGHGALVAVSGALIPVWIEAHEGGRLRTLSADGTCRVVAPGRLYWASGQTLEGVEALEAWFEGIGATSSSVDVAAYWAEVVREGAKELHVTDVAEATLGGASIPQVDAVVVALFDANQYFKMRGGALTVRSREAVERAAREAGEEERRRTALSQAQAHFTAVLEGEVSLSAEDPSSRRFLEIVEGVALEGRSAPDFKGAMELLEALSAAKGEPETRARELLVRLGYFAPDENLHVRRAGIRRGFSDEVLEAARVAADESIGLAKRVDLRHLTTVAIDDARTTEVDDAFAIDGDRLVVFIADVASWVRPGDVLDQECAERATTVYLVEGKIPMLPSTIGESIASLSAQEDRPALAFSFEIDERGNLRGFEAAEAICSVDRRLTYDEVDGRLTGASLGAYDAMLDRVAEWMDAHRQRRTEQGALHLQRREVDLRPDTDGGVEVVPIDANGPGRSLVSEMMVAVCAGVAQWCLDQSVPVIYRSQAEPDTPPAPGAPLDDPAAVVAVLRTLKPTQQSTRPGRHYTLGVGGYCQVTSPIRRYLDLVNHRQIKGYLRRRMAPHTEGDLNGLIAQSEEITSRARKAMFETRRHWLLRHMAGQPDRLWSASVIRPLGRRWLAEIDDLAFQVAFMPSGWVEPGQEVTLEVKRVDLDANMLRIDEAPRD